MAHWIYNERYVLKLAIRIIFGAVWLTDGLLKLQPGTPAVFSDLVAKAALGQPVWMLPWFSFWAATVNVNPAFWVYLIVTCETLLGLGLIFGFMRKTTYSLGVAFSLLIWSVPEGLGGPYGPSSTNIGTGIIYAIAFLMLIIINVVGGTNKYTLDRWIEKRVKWWHMLAEFEE